MGDYLVEYEYEYEYVAPGGQCQSIVRVSAWNSYSLACALFSDDHSHTWDISLR